jgi:WD40 repeat protein
MPVFYTSFSPDGTRLLAFGLTSICMWNAKSLKRIAELKDGHTAWVHTVAFSSDGSLIASGGRDTRVCIWDGFTGALKETLPQRHEEPVVNVHFVLSDSVIVAIDRAHQILCWSVARTKWAVHRARAMRGTMHTGAVVEIASSPDRKLFATFSFDKTIKLWNPESATEVGQPMLGSDKVKTGAFTIDGSKIVAGYHDGTVRIWEVATQILLHTLRSGPESVSTIAVSPDGRLVASGGGRLCLWDVDTGELMCMPLEKYIGSLAFNRTGRRLVLGSSDSYVTVVDIRFGSFRLTTDTFILKGHTSYVNDVSSSPSGSLLASAGQDGTLRVWDTDFIDLSPGNNPTDLEPKHQTVTSLAVSRDGTRLLSGGDTGDFQIWDFLTGQRVGHMFHSPEGEVKIIRFSSSSTLWASAHSVHCGGNVCIWEWQAADLAPTTYTLLCGQDSITCIEFTEDRTHIVVGGTDGSVRSWNLSSRSCVANFDCASIPKYLAISHDGRYLACASNDTTFSVWDLVSHQLVDRSEPDHTRRVSFLSFSPRKAMVTTRRGEKVDLWDIGGHQIRCLASFEPRQSGNVPPSWRPAFSLDGKYLFYGTYTFNIGTLLHDTGSAPMQLRPDRSEGRPISPVSHLFVDEALGRIHSNQWPEPNLVLPADVYITEWVAHENTIAFGSSDGRVFIIHFPEGSL